MEAKKNAEIYEDEIRRLKEQIEEQNDLIDAIKDGGVDALAIYRQGKPEIYTLESTDFVYRVLVENFGESALNITETGLIIYANSAFEDLIGVPGNSIIGKQLESFITEKDLPVFRKLFQRAFSGQSRGEIQLISRNNEKPVFASLSSLYPRFAGIGVVFTDLSEKKQREEDNARLEQKIIDNNIFLGQIMDSTLELITTFDIQLNYLSANRIALEYMGVKAENIIGKGLLDVRPALKNTSFHIKLLRALAGESIHERQVQENGDKQVYFDMFFKPLMINNHIAGAMVMARDVTDSVQSKKKLEEINSAMDRKIMQLQLFDTELSAISQLAIKEIEQQVMQLPKLLDLIRYSRRLTPVHVTTNAASIEKIVVNIQAQLVSLQKLNAGIETEGAKIPVNLNLLLEEVKKNISDIIRANDVVLDSGNLPPVRVNPIQMHLVFSKIISNAIRLRRNGERPYIKILADLSQQELSGSASKVKYWKISFSDNGLGFENSHYDKIPGTNEIDSREVETDLSVCRKIVQNHNGFMTAHSVAGVGGTVTIHLPY